MNPAMDDNTADTGKNTLHSHHQHQEHDVIGCTDCEVYLCVNCYQLFHMVPNLVDKKDELRDLFRKEQRAKANKANKTTPDNKDTFENNLHINEMIKKALTCDMSSGYDLMSTHDSNFFNHEIFEVRKNMLR